jgi:hypothetical protein
MANKALVLTMPARGSFYIRARHKGLAVVSASSCRTRRWHGRTMQALWLLCSNDHDNDLK